MVRPLSCSPPAPQLHLQSSFFFFHLLRFLWLILQPPPPLSLLVFFFFFCTYVSCADNDGVIDTRFPFKAFFSLLLLLLLLSSSLTNHESCSSYHLRGSVPGHHFLRYSPKIMMIYIFLMEPRDRGKFVKFH